MNNRPSLGFEDEEDPSPQQTADLLDLSTFQPKPIARPDKDKVAQAAEKANFKSREVKPALVATPVASKSARRRRTGRSAQLNLKVRPDTIETFYAIADAYKWGLGEAFEKAVELLGETFPAKQ